MRIPWLEMAALLVPFVLIALVLTNLPKPVSPSLFEACDTACRSLSLGTVKIDSDENVCFCGGYGPVRAIDLQTITRVELMGDTE